MAFDYAGAIKAGYSDQEIQGYLQKSGRNFDVVGAKKSGYSDEEISGYLSKNEPKKKLNPVVDFLLGSSIRAAQDIGTGLAQRNSGVNEAQQQALDAQAKLEALARSSNDPELQKRVAKLGANTNRVVSSGANEMAGQFSEDVNMNPLLRGARSGAEIAGTASAVNLGAKAIANAPKAVQATGNAIKAVPDKFNYMKKWGEARQLAASKYDGVVDVADARHAILKALAKQLKIDPSALADRKAADILKSLDETKNVSGLLERTKFWNEAYKATGGVKGGAENKLFDVAAKAAKMFIKEQAPEVAKYTNKMRLYYQVPKEISKAIFRFGVASMGVNQLKSIFK